MEVRRGSPREDIQDSSLEKEPQFLRNIKSKEFGVEWVEVGWEHTAGAPGHKGPIALSRNQPIFTYLSAKANVWLSLA